MEQLPRTQYSQEFREQSVKFFKESGLTLVERSRYRGETPLSNQF
jgi:transposase